MSLSLCLRLVALSGTVVLSPILRGDDLGEMSTARGHNGMVVTVSPPASDAGLEILKAGGNAVDAAVAVEFALAVTWPEAGNIGGGGFMMVHRPGGEDVVCVEYRETAPRAATETFFTPEDGKFTHKIVGVPGAVQGMATAHERFGKVEWIRLLEPAIRLAEAGFAIDEALAGSLNGVLKDRIVREGESHAEFRRVFAKPDGTEWIAGDVLAQPELATTLKRIAEQGSAGFYEGETAALLVAEMQRGDGVITLEDLAAYRAKVRPAIHGKFRGHDVYAPPPPSSGGICLVEMLNILETFDLRDHDRFSARNLHLMAEAMKRAYCDRARFLGDGDFVKIPPRLIRPFYARKLAADIDPGYATPSATLAPNLPLGEEPPDTTHFSIIDRDHLAVSNTTTLEGSFGARIVVKGAGFVLNNEMGDFNWFPGVTNRAGRIGTAPNRIEPGKRMLSSQCPAIVAYKGHPVLITGSPGGRTIINTTLQMVLNAIEFEMDLEDSMRAPRIHHQWFPDVLTHEAGGGRITGETLAELASKGHRLSARGPGGRQGDAHSIAIDLKTGEFHGVADWRRRGRAAGY